MIKAKDLMLGDWILASGKPIRVTLATLSMCDNVNFKPISITPEIMEKNFGRPYGVGWYDAYELKRIEGEGIYYVRDAYCYPSKERFSIIKADNEEITFCSLKYVHELQHALKFFGVEKEIVL